MFLIMRIYYILCLITTLHNINYINTLWAIYMIYKLTECSIRVTALLEYHDHVLSIDPVHVGFAHNSMILNPVSSKPLYWGY